MDDAQIDALLADDSFVDKLRARLGNTVGAPADTARLDEDKQRKDQALNQMAQSARAQPASARSVGFDRSTPLSKAEGIRGVALDLARELAAGHLSDG